MKGGGRLAPPVIGAVQSHSSFCNAFSGSGYSFGKFKSAEILLSIVTTRESPCETLTCSSFTYRTVNIYASKNPTFYKGRSLHPHLHPLPLWTEPHLQPLSEDNIHILFHGTGLLHRAAACRNCAGSSLLSDRPERGAHLCQFSIMLLLWIKLKFAYHRSQECYQWSKFYKKATANYSLSLNVKGKRIWNLQLKQNPQEVPDSEPRSASSFFLVLTYQTAPSPNNHCTSY